MLGIKLLISCRLHWMLLGAISVFLFFIFFSHDVFDSLRYKNFRVIYFALVSSVIKFKISYIMNLFQVCIMYYSFASYYFSEKDIN